MSFLLGLYIGFFVSQTLLRKSDFLAKMYVFFIKLQFIKEKLSFNFFPKSRFDLNSDFIVYNFYFKSRLMAVLQQRRFDVKAKFNKCVGSFSEPKKKILRKKSIFTKILTNLKLYVPKYRTLRRCCKFPSFTQSLIVSYCNSTSSKITSHSFNRSPRTGAAAQRGEKSIFRTSLCISKSTNLILFKPSTFL
jgi:hypothetical protein